MKLTDNDYDTLDRARDLRERFDSGIFPTGAGQHSHFRRLERLGLIEFEGTGHDIDGLSDGDVQVYRLTKAGIDALDARERSTAR